MSVYRVAGQLHQRWELHPQPQALHMAAAHTTVVGGGAQHGWELHPQLWVVYMAVAGIAERRADTQAALAYTVAVVAGAYTLAALARMTAAHPDHRLYIQIVPQMVPQMVPQVMPLQESGHIRIYSPGQQ